MRSGQQCLGTSVEAVRNGQVVPKPDVRPWQGERPGGLRTGRRQLVAHEWVYGQRVDEWSLYDNSSGAPVLIAGGRESDELVPDRYRWELLRSLGDVQRPESDERMSNK